VDEASEEPHRVAFGAHRTGEGSYELVGELDVHTAQVLEGILERDRAQELTFDAARLSFLDSSGMRVLLKAVVRGRTITVRSPTPIVARTLRVTGVDRLPGLRIEY
jgi:anti-anti-sigma factor